MACAPANLPFERWRGASALVLALALMSLVCTVTGAAERPLRSVLLFPVRTHWLSAPLAEKLTGALSDTLTSAGFTVTVFDANAPVFRNALPDPEIPLETSRHALALAAGAHASLTAELSKSEVEAALEVDLAGAVARRSAKLQLTVPVTADEEKVAWELGRQTAEALTSELWVEAGADEAGRREGAVQRYAAGKAAIEQGRSQEALRELEAALAGDPDMPEYLLGAAEAQVAVGNYDSALVRLRRAASLAAGDKEILLRQGEVALLADKGEEAEGAFRAAQAADFSDLRALEGLARAARARGQFERSQDYYRELVSRLPDLPAEVRSELSSVPSLLAGAREDRVHLTGAPPDEIGRQLGLLYLGSGELVTGVRLLRAYHEKEDRSPYRDEDYLAVSSRLDDESVAIAREVQTTLAARALGQISDEATASRLDGLHTRSNDLASLAERIQVSPRLDPAHRYRVLAYNLLNESDFEALLYARSGDTDRERRADLLRSFYRKARQEALELGAALIGEEAAG